MRWVITMELARVFFLAIWISSLEGKENQDFFLAFQKDFN
jgi:hypothetical protein